jgi:hypothetical protein
VQVAQHQPVVQSGGVRREIQHLLDEVPAAQEAHGGQPRHRVVHGGDFRPLDPRFVFFRYLFLRETLREDHF